MNNLVSSAVALLMRQGIFEPVFLVSQRLKGSVMGQYTVPGGKCENDETPAECVIRELMEETGIAAHDLTLLGERSFFKTNDGRDSISTVFLITEWDGFPSCLEPDINGPWQWMSRSDMQSRDDCGIALQVLDMLPHAG